jgi:ribosomal protein L16/L10AE
MKNFPDTVSFTKSHKKKSFKGQKAKNFFTYTSGLRIRRSVYMTHLQYETMRRISVRCLRLKKSRIYKKKSRIKDQSYDLPIDNKGKKKINIHGKRFSRKKIVAFRLRHHFYSPITKKPLQVRMGKGKGDPYNWISPTSSSNMVFEISRKIQNLYKLHRYAKKVSNVLPVTAKFIYNRQYLRREHNFFKYWKKR